MSPPPIKKRKKAYIILDELPSEILSRVFINLSLEDRKQVRLVCKKFYDACNILPILRKEMLSIDFCNINVCIHKKDKNGSDTRTNLNKYSSAIIDVLEKCNYQYINLSIRCTPYLKRLLTFWQKCGSRILCLCFTQCKISEVDLENIILYCPNLKSLTFGSCEINLESEIFDKIIDSNKNSGIGINLLNLDLFDNVKWLSNYTLNRICRIYPNLKNISIFNAHVIANDSDIESIDSKTCLTYPCLFHNIQLLGNSLEEFYIDCIGKDLDSSFKKLLFTDLTLHSDIKFKRLDMNNNKYFTSSLFLDLIKKQTCLEELNVSYCKWFSIKCLKELLKNCPKLNALSMLETSVSACFEVLEILAASRLEYMEVDGITRFEKSFRHIKPNYRMRELIMLVTDEYQISQLIKTFPNVICGIYAFINYEILKKISEIQTNLEKLSIERSCFKYFKARIIYQFKNLKELHFDSCSISYVKVFKTLKFPFLRRLSIVGCSKITVCHEKIISNSFPLLEYLNIEHTEISFDILVKIILGLPRLQTFFVEIYDGKSIDDCEDLLFNKLPKNSSLRTAIFKNPTGNLRIRYCLSNKVLENFEQKRSDGSTNQCCLRYKYNVFTKTWNRPCYSDLNKTV